MTDLIERAKAALQEETTPDEEWVLVAQFARALIAAGELANQVEQRMNDLGGYDNRFSVRQSLVAFRAALQEDTPNE